MSVTRDGNNFSTEFEVDRFLPGKCGWHFGSVEVSVSNGSSTTVPQSIVQPYDPISGESKTVNSSQDPVIIAVAITANPWAIAAFRRSPRNQFNIRWIQRVLST